MEDPNGFVMNVSDSVVGMHDQKQNPYEPFSTGEKMRRGANPKVFDNNGGTSKAGDAGTVESGYQGPVSFGAP